MDENAKTPASSFRKRLFGYDPTAVDDYLARAVETHEAVRAEVEKLRAAAPLARVGGDVANLLTMFAETVSSMRDDAAGDVDRVRAEATEYAEQQRSLADDYVHAQRTQVDDYVRQQRAEAEEYAAGQRAQAEQILADARDRARSEADALLLEARHELASVSTRWSAIERALDEAAGGVAAALAAVQRFSRYSGSELIDIADIGGTPTAAEHRPPEARAVSGPADPEPVDESGTVLPSLAAKMWQSRQMPPAPAGARLQYLLPPPGGDRPAD
jgi:hypothetical protein